DLLDRPDVLVRRDHQVPVRVRVEVEDHEGTLAAVDDQVALVVILRGLRAEDALLLFVLGCVRHVSEAPGRPDPEVGHCCSGYSHPRLRNQTTMPTRITTIAPITMKKAARSPCPGTSEFI